MKIRDLVQVVVVKSLKFRYQCSLLVLFFNLFFMN